MKKVSGRSSPANELGVEKSQTSTPAPSVPAQPELRSGGLFGRVEPVVPPKNGGGNRAELLAGAHKVSTPFQPMISSHELRLENKTGETVRIPVENYYLTAEGEARPEIKALVNTALRRDPRTQAQLDEKLTALHAAHEMSFRVKDENGHYNKIFQVPSHGSVIPLSAAHYERLVASMGPVMHALRDMLKVLYSNPNPTAKDLGIDHLPAEERDRVLETVTQSLYFEPKLRTPAMKDYPFLAVGGFDAAVGRLDHPEPTFFEYNLGTPSGLSNNIQLLEILRQVDPELYATFKDQLAKDETFSILRSGIESNALEWSTKVPLRRALETLGPKLAPQEREAFQLRLEETEDRAELKTLARELLKEAASTKDAELVASIEGALRRADGISVTIGPGVLNGAHPDVASIALFSGMAYVNPSDLYTDRRGDLRLRTESGDNPIVTGIYGRAEESFFFMSDKDGIPIRSPDFEHNEALGEKLGVKLEPHVVYEFEYKDWDNIKDWSSHEEIIGVHQNADGTPKLQQVYESMGRDPDRPELDPGSFASAVTSGALYYSGVGGRTVDDKRVFQAVSKHVAPKYADGPEAPIARPPQTLDVSDYQQFYDSKNLERFVVKAPDKSGGAGVMLMVNLTPEKRQQVVEEVKKAPHEFIVQEFIGASVMAAPEKLESGQTVYGTKVPDWRIFGVLDAKGRIRAGKNAHLIRTANAGSASTNTSQGGGYGIGVVLGDSHPRDASESVLPTIPEQPYVGASRMHDLRQFLTKLNELTEKAARPEALPRDGQLPLLASFQREVMDILGRDLSPLMQVARDFEEGRLDQHELYEQLLASRASMLEASGFVAKGVAEVVHDLLLTVDASPPTPEVQVDRETLRRKLRIRSTETPVRTRVFSSGGSKLETYETGVYEKGPHPFVDQLLGELKAVGGDLRMIRNKDVSTGAQEDTSASPYFTVDPHGVPVIAIDLSQDFALSALAHEREHFLLWREARESLLQAGTEPQKANLRAMEQVNVPKMREETERRAVNAEVAMQKKVSGAWNQGAHAPALSASDPGYVARFGYPKVEALRELLHGARRSKQPIDEAAALSLLRSLISLATESRTAGAARLRREAETRVGSSNVERRLEGQRLRHQAGVLERTSAFELIFQADRARFESEDLMGELVQLFEKALSPDRGFELEHRRLAPILLAAQSQQ